MNYYLVIGHACDEESAWLYLDFEEEKSNEFLEKKFIAFVLEELATKEVRDNTDMEYEDIEDCYVHIDFIFKSETPIKWIYD